MPNTSPQRLAVEESGSTLRLRLTGDFDLAGVARGTANGIFTLTRAGERLSIVDEPEAA